jgi:PII-like signaling protein
MTHEGSQSASPMEDSMNGFQLTFYTEQNKRHGHRTICEWLLHEVKALGIGGATVISGSEGIGHAGAHHAAHMLRLNDQPLQIIVAVTDEEAQRLLDIVRAERVHVFYTRSPIEFGLLGEDDPQHHPKKFSLFHKRTQ